MTATSAMSPQTCVDDASVGAVAWSNPDNAKTSNDIYSFTAGGGGTLTSHYLKATNFGFNIPIDATINGILVEVEKHRRAGAYGEVDNKVQIVKADGTLGTTNKADGVTDWGETDHYVSYGADNNLWGETDWTYDKINDVDFGVVISAVTTISFTQAYIDHIRITVYYTEYVEPPVPPPIYTIDTSSSAFKRTDSVGKRIYLNAHGGRRY